MRRRRAPASSSTADLLASPSTTVLPLGSIRNGLNEPVRAESYSRKKPWTWMRLNITSATGSTSSSVVGGKARVLGCAGFTKSMLAKPCPLPHQTSCPHGAQFPGGKLPSEIERCQLPLVLNVNMRWFVIVEEHSNDDPEKRWDYRSMYATTGSRRCPISHPGSVQACRLRPSRVALSLPVSGSETAARDRKPRGMPQFWRSGANCRARAGVRGAASPDKLAAYRDVSRQKQGSRRHAESNERR